MASRLKDIKSGSVSLADFAYWINERTSIYNKKEAGLPKPWTDDEILQQYKFTNAFRQLDRGTVVLHDMIDEKDVGLLNQELTFFNIVWYRLFNWHEHAYNCGWVTHFTELEDYILKCSQTHKKIFTGAHMTTGVAYEDKHISYLRAAKIAWERRHEFVSFIKNNQTMEAVCEELLSLYMVGKFIAYELVCDLRFSSLLKNASDKLTWANMGPGAQRGLKRLGLPHENHQQGLSSMVLLYERLMEAENLLDYNVKCANVPFELREVEHSLCEFDKYCRVKFGEGRPRGRYPGGAE